MIDLTNQVIGRWTVLEQITAGSKAKWLCKCECGVVKTVLQCHLRSGRSKSCGCLVKDLNVAKNTRHGHSVNQKTSSAYNAWKNMKARCTNPNNTRYSSYGGAGVTVCERWLESFDNFIADMGEPEEGQSLDRIDGIKHYSKNTCRWADASTQCANQDITRSNKTGYIGAYKSSSKRNWESYISWRKRRISLGYYESAELAALVRDEYVRHNNLPHRLNDE